MAYEGKTNWQLNDTVMPEDMNRIEQGIKNVESELADAGGVTILEASTTNVIDFNTLTEPGVYLIKNCNSSTTVNSSAKSATVNFDFVLIVANTSTGYIYQYVFGSNIVRTATRYYNIGTTSWTAWDTEIPAGIVGVGVFQVGMKCTTPTANDHLANKYYVDRKTWTADKITGGRFPSGVECYSPSEAAHLANKQYVDSRTWAAGKITAGTLAGQVTANESTVANVKITQIRNIQASTTDLTPGTSTLTTGNIYLVFE